MESLLFAISCCMSWRTFEGGWHPLIVCLLLNCMKGLGGFVTHWNYSEQFFFLKHFLLNIWLHMFWKLHIMLMMLWRIQKYNKDSPSYIVPQHAIEKHYLNHSFDATSTLKTVSDSLQSQVKKTLKLWKHMMYKMPFLKTWPRKFHNLVWPIVHSLKAPKRE